MSIPSSAFRTYPSPRGPRTYFTATDLSAVHISDVPPDVARRSRYVEAVHPSGLALVLKSTETHCGIIPEHTEPKTRAATWNVSAT